MDQTRRRTALIFNKPVTVTVAVVINPAERKIDVSQIDLMKPKSWVRKRTDADKPGFASLQPSSPLLR
jgi:hypothetical protein